MLALILDSAGDKVFRPPRGLDLKFGPEADSKSAPNECASAAETVECLVQTDRFLMARRARAPEMLLSNHGQPIAVA